MQKSKAKYFIVIITGFIILVIGAVIYWRDTPYRNSRKLITAITNESIEDIKEMLENGVDPNVLTVSETVGKLLKFVEDTPDRPLAEACGVGNIEIVKLLIDYGATAEQQDGAGWSPLSETIFFYQPDDVEIVKLLLENGATMVDDEEYTLPVFRAAEMYPRDYDSTKVNGSKFADGYSEEVAKGITDITMLLLGEQSIDIQNSCGDTLLIIAAKQENIYLVNHLISVGCDTQIKNDDGKTAYDYAVEAGNAELIEMLKNESE